MQRFHPFAFCCLLAASIFVTAAPVSVTLAQETGDETSENEAEASEAEGSEAQGEPAAEPSEGPFIDAMSRFSTVLGSMHFLRTLCGTDDTSIWRDEMNAFLQAQEPNEADRSRLIASFNSGYRAYESTYRNCTAAARTAHNRYQREGAALSRDMLTRYGN